MEREVRLFLWGAVLIGFLFAAGIGIAADDPGMVKGAAAGLIGGLIAAPFVARLWKGDDVKR